MIEAKPRPTTALVEPLLLEVPEALQLTGLGRSLFWTKLTSGEIKSVKVGRRRLVPLDGLRQWVAGLCDQAE